MNTTYWRRKVWQWWEAHRLSMLDSEQTTFGSSASALSISRATVLLAFADFCSWRFFEASVVRWNQRNTAEKTQIMHYDANRENCFKSQYNFPEIKLGNTTPEAHLERSFMKSLVRSITGLVLEKYKAGPIGVGPTKTENSRQNLCTVNVVSPRCSSSSHHSNNNHSSNIVSIW